MEMNEQDREEISYLVINILERHNIKVNPEWESDFSKEHDFECMIEEFEKYLTIVENYGDDTND